MSENLHYNSLLQVLRLVASSLETQQAYFPDFVDVPDEIALEFDRGYRVVPELERKKIISAEVSKELKKLNSYFDSMSNDQTLWTIEKIVHDEHWCETRSMARAILQLLEEPYEPPQAMNVMWVT